MLGQFSAAEDKYILYAIWKNQPKAKHTHGEETITQWLQTTKAKENNKCQLQ